MASAAEWAAGFGGLVEDRGGVATAVAGDAHRCAGEHRVGRQYRLHVGGPALVAHVWVGARAAGAFPVAALGLQLVPQRACVPAAVALLGSQHGVDAAVSLLAGRAADRQNPDAAGQMGQGGRRGARASTASEIGVLPTRPTSRSAMASPRPGRRRATGTACRRRAAPMPPPLVLINTTDAGGGRLGVGGDGQHVLAALLDPPESARAGREGRR